MSLMISKPELLIIGQGLGGTILGLEAERRGILPTVVDRGHRPSSSMVAAGMVNPFILKRRKLVWRAEDFIPTCERFYAWSEAHLGVQAYHPSAIYRIIHDEAEWNDWDAKSEISTILPFHAGMPNALPSAAQVDAPLGFFKTAHSAWMDIPQYILASRDYWHADGRYILADVNAADLKKVNGKWHYDGRSYNLVCLCGGVSDPLLASFFPDLPFTPAKGHVLDVEVPGWGLSEVLHGAVFVIPLGDERYRIGSTYSWHLLDESVEEKELKKLKEGFERICTLPYSTVESRAGVRPSTRDRRPFMGQNPDHSGMFLFNGLGSRAVMNGPSLAGELLDYMFTGKALEKETDLHRFA